jgi:hypothetical protein
VQAIVALAISLALLVGAAANLLTPRDYPVGDLRGSVLFNAVVVVAFGFTGIAGVVKACSALLRRRQD